MPGEGAQLQEFTLELQDDEDVQLQDGQVAEAGFSHGTFVNRKLQEQDDLPCLVVTRAKGGPELWRDSLAKRTLRHNMRRQSVSVPIMSLIVAISFSTISCQGCQGRLGSQCRLGLMS